jgi:hypothetical protein
MTARRAALAQSAVAIDLLPDEGERSVGEVMVAIPS